MRILSSNKEKTIRQYVPIFIFGVIIGITITYLLSVTDPTFTLNSINDYDSFGYIDAPVGYVGNRKHFSENTSVADEFYKKVRVLCWIMTDSHNHAKRARHVKATWGKRCNILLFMSYKKDDTLPAVTLPAGEGQDNLFAKTKEALRYVYKHHRNDADWFLKADDDTYVIMENLRYMLMSHKASEPLYFGCRFKSFAEQGHMSGGAGYVLSGEAVRRFVLDEALPETMSCSQTNTGNEEEELNKCLQRVGVKVMDSRDSFGRGRFFPFSPSRHVIPFTEGKDFWYWNYVYYKGKQGMEGCSDIAISFHHITPRNMYVMEYLIYYLRPVGITYQVDIELK